jgi:hypothetical protein
VKKYETFFWAICYKCGSVVIDEYGQACIYGSRSMARSGVANGVFNESVHVERVEVA